MAPIRIALIGLSASAATAWASLAHLPYLLSARGKAKYEIVALCNSSQTAARAAIEKYGLPPSTKAYGDAAALAADPEVQLVVCSTRVDTHYDVVKASVAAGKDVFVEWPLAHNVEAARELVRLAKQGGGKTVVGLQGQLAPAALKIKELLGEGSLGKVLSSEVRAAGGTVDRELLSAGLKYFTKKKVGGNIFTIGLAHLFDLAQSVIGEVAEIDSHFQIQRPEVKIRDPSTNTVTETVRSDVPDLIMASGTIKESDTAEAGATFHIRFRRGQPFKNEAACVWHINCERGEIRLTAPGGAALQASASAHPMTIEVHDFETDEVRTVEWQWPEWQEEAELPALGRNVAALYDAFADGAVGSYPTFEDALRRHEQLDGMLSSWPSNTSA